MPSFQSPRAEERQAVGAGGEALVDRADAVLEERAVLRRTRAAGRTTRARRARAAAPRGTARARRARRCRRSCATYSADDERQPQQIVGAARAQAAAARLVPPVLHVAFDELPAGGAQQMRARELGPREAAAPSRPAADRGSRTRRPAGSSRRASRGGSSCPDRRSQRLISTSNESSGVRTWIVSSVASHDGLDALAARPPRASTVPWRAISARDVRRRRRPGRAGTRSAAARPAAGRPATCSAAHGSSPAPNSRLERQVAQRRRPARASRCGR